MDCFLIFVLKNPKFWWRVFEEESTAKMKTTSVGGAFHFIQNTSHFLKMYMLLSHINFYLKKISFHQLKKNLGTGLTHLNR